MTTRLLQLVDQGAGLSRPAPTHSAALHPGALWTTRSSQQGVLRTPLKPACPDGPSRPPFRWLSRTLSEPPAACSPLRRTLAVSWQQADSAGALPRHAALHPLAAAHGQAHGRRRRGQCRSAALTPASLAFAAGAVSSVAPCTDAATFSRISVLCVCGAPRRVDMALSGLRPWSRRGVPRARCVGLNIIVSIRAAAHGAVRDAA